jgi:hypothetical protein
MKTAERRTSNRWTTMPGNRAHGVEDQNSSCSTTRAAKQKEIQPMASCFFLTSPFIELIGKWKLFKKAKDCELVGGEHEWYNIDGLTSGCYHCLVERQGQLWKNNSNRNV